MAEKQAAVGELWHEFSQNTSCHGVNKLSNFSQRSKIKIVVWVFIVLSSASYLTNTLVHELRSYYSYPTLMTMYTQPLNVIEYPAITICNLNSLNKSAIKQDQRNDDYYTKLGAINVYYSSMINWTDPFYDNEGFFRNRTKEEILEEHKQMIGFNKFLMQTMFNLKKLNSTDYFTIKITTKGPCLTSNPNKTILSKHAGHLQNLLLDFDLDEPNDYYGKWMGEGLLLMIHDHKEEPDLYGSTGYYVQPGTEVFAAITKTQFEYLPSPYQAMPNTYCRDEDGSGYRRSACFKECYAKFLYEECKCLSFTYNNKYYCSKYDELTCAEKAFAKFHNDSLIMDGCGCQMSCKFTRYEATMTSTTYPSAFYGDFTERITSGRNLEYFRKNYVRLHIYFDQLKTTIAKQQPKYSSAGEIFANLGGQMGLFLGASIVTITEMGEFLLYLLWCLFKKARKQETRVQNISRRKSIHVHPY